MTENLRKQPRRGILKQSTSFEQRDLEPPSHSRLRNPHFDEQNILETFHPADKDYGFMKTNEPETPYEYRSEEGDEGAAGAERKDREAKELPPHKITSECAGPPRRMSEPAAATDKKKHYNEFDAVKLARQLMMEDRDEDNDMGGSNSKDAGEVSNEEDRKAS